MFNWLHITDLHCILDSQHQKILTELLNDGIIKEIKNISVDCIVITGDILDKGDVNYSDGIIDKIFYIYDQCRDACSWKYGEARKRLFFCPGNHDLNRNACCKHEKKDVSRRDLMKEWAKKTNTSTVETLCSLSTNEAELDLLRIVAFRDFMILMEIIYQIDQLKANTANANKSTINLINEARKAANKCYKPVSSEVTIFHPIAHKISIEFCGFNTALLAGQTAERNDLEEYYLLKDLFLTQFKILENGYIVKGSNDRKVKELKTEYVVKKERFYRETANDDMNLIFISHKEATQLRDKYKNKDCVVITFGHHPITCMNTHAAQNMRNTIKSIKSTLYLCGHTHEPGMVDELVDGIAEVTVGALRQNENERDMGGYSLGRLYKSGNKIKAYIEKRQYMNTSLGLAWVRKTTLKDHTVN